MCSAASMSKPVPVYSAHVSTFCVSYVWHPLACIGVGTVVWTPAGGAALSLYVVRNAWCVGTVVTAVIRLVRPFLTS